jgi:DNA-directed RNA polymerase subunit K/omega
MLHPTIDELTKGKYNRYELALATARCARLVTDEYVRQHDAAEKSITGNKETDKPLNTMIDKELRDEKAVHVAVNRLKDGVYVIDVHANDKKEEAEEETPAEETSETATDAE